MKKINIICTLIFYLFGIISCTKENSDDGKTYYKFSNIDNSNIINYNYVPNQIIIYENQNGDQLRFKVISNIAKKEGQYSGSSFVGSYSSLDYYYDSKIIRLEIIENQNNYREDQIIYNFSKSDNIFKNAINFPIWNISNSTFYDEIDRPFNISLFTYNSVNKIQMTINGHLFNKVVEINSSNNSILQLNYGGLLPKNVNKLFYDYEFGIIEFTDIEGKIWKVKYP